MIVSTLRKHDRFGIRARLQAPCGFPAGRHAGKNGGTYGVGCPIIRAMSYGVVWSENEGPLHAGRLDLAGGSILFDGTSREMGRCRHELFYEELGDVWRERRREARLSKRPTLVFQRRNGSCIRVSSLDGAGALHELAERVQVARALSITA
jgi:hypothetical protein